MHYLGRGAQQDKQKGIKIIRENKSDEFKLGEDEGLGSIWAAHILSDTPAAFKFFQMCQLGSDRDWLCKHLMAVCLYHGFGTIADRSKMAGIFEELANEGHIDCQLWIGRCYYYGWGVSEDPSKAFEWIDMAASQGNPYAQWWAATCYFSGYGVTKDYAMAADLSRKSADQGNRHGQNSLGDYYRFGYGVAVNIEAAAYWYRKSAEQGCTHAIGNLIRLGLSP
ncbi:uncharacterized protein BJ171DRAFT_516594 [Polychytrium aggregatum]|uniref:uncharacterized protein n=1 Tax=Polychytrium aggregatum TaxID=110093 RepID=UPI0022FE4EF7|nr:uncharacterized protein BJ171DRAFT_516594 [Polychytrium aggregatum]KAI9201811.1 hypothetical protein BJ171DRAFT_516594 [Polychytrium aggregatum]